MRIFLLSIFSLFVFSCAFTPYQYETDYKENQIEKYEQRFIIVSTEQSKSNDEIYYLKVRVNASECKDFESELKKTDTSFRLIDKWKGVKYIDIADKIIMIDNEEAYQLYNFGIENGYEYYNIIEPSKNDKKSYRYLYHQSGNIHRNLLTITYKVHYHKTEEEYDKWKERYNLLTPE